MSARGRVRHVGAAVIPWLVLWGVLELGVSFARAQGGSALPNPSDVVSPQTFVSLDAIPRGKEFQAAVVVHIANGFHMNSHTPSEDYLIATTLTPQLPAGFDLVTVSYPNGRNEKFSFSPDKPLNVYTGSVTLQLRLKSASAAPIGVVAIPMTLRYQACNSTTCLPPVRVPVNVQLRVIAAGAPSHAVHPEIFSSIPSGK